MFVCTPASQGHHAARASDTLRVESLGTDGDGTLMTLATVAPRTDSVARAMSDRAAILYASGTTGRSKGAVLAHGNLASNTDVLLENWRFTAEDRLIPARPIFHTHGLFMTNMTIVAGATMIWLTRFGADKAIDLMGDTTVLMGVPTFYTRLLKSDRLNRDTTAHMRLFASGWRPVCSRAWSWAMPSACCWGWIPASAAWALPCCC